MIRHQKFFVYIKEIKITNILTADTGIIGKSILKLTSSLQHIIDF